MCVTVVYAANLVDVCMYFQMCCMHQGPIDRWFTEVNPKSYGCVYFRIIGLCLLQNEICPLYLNRHVLKYILGRKVGWHDLAFFDPVMYEGMRQLVHDAETKDFTSMFSALELTFAIDLSQEEVSHFLL